MTIYPIWQDRFLTISAESAEFRIMANGTEVYHGKAYRRPGESSISIRLNGICADYMTQTDPDFSSEGYNDISLTTFRADYKVSSSWVTGTTFAFINNRTYKYGGAVNNVISAPIARVLDSRQFLIYSVMRSHYIDATLKFKNGSSEVVTLGDYSSAADNEGLISSLSLRDYANIAEVTIAGKKWKVTGCHRYAIHYTNALGGWDSLVFEGGGVKEVTPSRKSIEVDYDNSISTHRGKRNYINEYETRITLKTGWLTDAESSLMHHLLNTTTAFIEDMDENTILPVVIDDQTFKVKTFRNEAGMVQYELSCTIAQTTARK